MKSVSYDYRKIVILSLILFFSGVVAVTNYSLFRLRSDTLDAGIAQADTYTRSFESFITQNISVIDLVTTSLAQNNAAPDNINTSRLFQVIISRNPGIRSLNLLDPAGKIILSTEPMNRGLTFHGSGSFPQASQPEPVLQIGHPCVGRDLYSNPQCGEDQSESVLSGQRYFIPVTKSIPTTKLGYQLLVMLNPDFYINYFNQGVPANSGEISIYRYDGLILLRSNEGKAINHYQPEFFKRLLLNQKELGHLDERFHPDSVLSYRTSSLYPLVIITQLSADEVLKNWLTERNSLYATLIPTLILTVILASLYFHRQSLLQKQKERSERLERINAAGVFNHAREGIIIASPLFRIEDVNEAFTRITQISRIEALGRSFFQLFLPNLENEMQKEMMLAIEHQGHWHYEFLTYNPAQEPYYLMLTLTAIRDEAQQIHQYILFLSDISEIKAHEQQLELAARQDSLTKLPNRRCLYERLSKTMAISAEMNSDFAIIFIDLDGFKAINDGYGHEAGDQLLIAMSKRFENTLRDQDTIARIGGDEFVAIINDLKSHSELIPVLNRMKAKACENVTFGTNELRVSASMGIVISRGIHDIDELLKLADKAMYQAKQSGKNRWSINNSAA